MRSIVLGTLLAAVLMGPVCMSGMFTYLYFRSHRRGQRLASEAGEHTSPAAARRLVVSVAEWEQPEQVFERVNAREIRLEGGMYDIALAVQRGDSMFVLLLRDIKEERYLRAIANVFDEGRIDARSPASVWRSVSVGAFAGILPKHPSVSPAVASLSYPPAQKAGYRSCIPEVPDPPPWS
ncbi:MAG: hypothetical protein R2834_05915 [Rhodothermales bacterium]